MFIFLIDCEGAKDQLEIEDRDPFLIGALETKIKLKHKFKMTFNFFFSVKSVSPSLAQCLA